MKFTLFFLLLLPSLSFALECSFRSHADLGKLVLAQVQNLSCSPHRVHLTFDDGPHPVYTPLILQELKLRGVKSTFFVSTTNIAPDHVAQRNIVKQIMDSGHLVASHGHHHEAYDLRLGGNGREASTQLTEKEQLKEISLSTQYLNEATGNRFSRQHPLLFRFPYGRGALPSDSELDEMERRGQIRFTSTDRAARLRQYRSLSAPLHEIAEKGYGHLLWNLDSEDSTASAPTDTPESKAAFVANNLKNMCHSANPDLVTLFHDIKAFNPEVVSVVIDLGKCLGLSFVDAPTILSSQTLRAAGTYIPNEAIKSAPVKRIDQIGDIIASLGKDCDEDHPPQGACYSQDLNRYFHDCQSGEVSICIKGEWFQKTEQKLSQCRARGL